MLTVIGEVSIAHDVISIQFPDVFDILRLRQLPYVRGLIPENTKPIVKFAGQIRISNILVMADSDADIGFPNGTKHYDIQVSNCILQGVMAINSLGNTIYECSVDYVEDIKRQHRRQYYEDGVSHVDKTLSKM